ncbi:MAG: hypothetical protein IKT46_00180 [Clostridia bacterium]|nr:hypothetical protein [Clostridia bacterium]
MKRKALITSTAVLLVALMCLATASYAWFTSANTNSIEAFKIDVTASDGALLLAAADASSNYSAGAFKPTLNVVDWDTAADWAIIDEAFVAHSTADAKSFYPATYSDTANNWTTADADAAGYMLFSFWVRAPKAGTATINVNTSANATFQAGIKYALGVSDTAEQGEMTIYDIDVDSADSYRPCNAAGAVSVKDDGTQLFVPADDAATGFAAARTQAALGNDGYSIKFDEAGDKLVTVAIWLEGMDKDCSGSWSMQDQQFALSIAWA